MNLTIPENLFDLTPEQEKLSKTMYNGKIIKCIVAPYHTYNQLENIIKYTPSTFLFPERELSIPQLRQFISMICNSKSNDEFRIITSNQNIIMDMIDGCVRVLTEYNTIVDCPCKTFMSNIHDIRHNLLENESYQISKEEKIKSKDKIRDLISKIKLKSEISSQERSELLAEIDLIGEELISSRLKDMIYTLKIKK